MKKKISKVIVITVFEDGTSEFSETNINYSKDLAASDLRELKIKEGHCPDCKVNISAIEYFGCQALYCSSGLANIIS